MAGIQEQLLCRQCRLLLWFMPKHFRPTSDTLFLSPDSLIINPLISNECLRICIGIRPYGFKHTENFQGVISFSEGQ